MSKCLRATPLVLVIAVGSAAPAVATSLHWSGGSTDLALQAAAPCTLLVTRSPGESWPPEWHLIWVAEQAGGSPPVSFLATTRFVVIGRSR
jgi:hypothetical protein